MCNLNDEAMNQSKSDYITVCIPRLYYKSITSALIEALREYALPESPDETTRYLFDLLIILSDEID